MDAGQRFEVPQVPRMRTRLRTGESQCHLLCCERIETRSDPRGRARLRCAQDVSTCRWTRSRETGLSWRISMPMAATCTLRRRGQPSVASNCRRARFRSQGYTSPKAQHIPLCETVGSIAPGEFGAMTRLSILSAAGPCTSRAGRLRRAVANRNASFTRVGKMRQPGRTALMSMNHIRPWRHIERRKSRARSMVGNRSPIGGDAPICGADHDQHG